MDLSELLNKILISDNSKELNIFLGSFTENCGSYDIGEKRFMLMLFALRKKFNTENVFKNKIYLIHNLSLYISDNDQKSCYMKNNISACNNSNLYVETNEIIQIDRNMFPIIDKYYAEMDQKVYQFYYNNDINISLVEEQSNKGKIYYLVVTTVLQMDNKELIKPKLIQLIKFLLDIK